MRILVVVTFLNEARYMPAFLESLAAQSRTPDLVLLADDGSTDESAGMARAFAERHEWARVERRPPRDAGRDRLAGGTAVVNFEWGLKQAADFPWDVAVKMDADLRLVPDLFAEIERRFAEDPELGMAGPYLAVRQPDGRMVRQRCPETHVEGPAKFYRRACYDDIAPLPAMLGWDTIDELRANMKGWRTRSFDMPSGDSEHMRTMGSHDGQLRGFRRWGEAAYAYGEHPLHVVLVGAQKSRDRPRLLGGISYVIGYIGAAARRMPRAESELRSYVRKDQLRRIRRRLLRAARA